MSVHPSPALLADVAASLGEGAAVAPRFDAVGGGSIHLSGRLRMGARTVFVKLNTAEVADNFAAEADGLGALAGAGAFRVPRPLATGQAQGRAWLVLEWLPLGGAPHGTAWAAAGRALAQQHRQTATTHGWWRDNYIGATPQPNAREPDWRRFFGEHRLGFQVALAGQAGYARLAARGERLLAALPRLLEGHRPAPSLLHGDLWSGNAAFLADGTPTLFDPAVHYGDRECDLAMAALFGGFPPAFFAAYAEVWPLPPGHAQRRRLYQLYHVINHANLFGGGYARQAEGIIDALLADQAE